jgi:hypothetical protein
MPDDGFAERTAKRGVDDRDRDSNRDRRHRDVLSRSLTDFVLDVSEPVQKLQRLELNLRHIPAFLYRVSLTRSVYSRHQPIEVLHG